MKRIKTQWAKSLKTSLVFVKSAFKMQCHIVKHHCNKPINEKNRAHMTRSKSYDINIVLVHGIVHKECIRNSNDKNCTKDRIV